MENIHTPAKYTLKELILYFLKLGALGFGGPVALVGYMHRDLVETKKWISEEDYKEGLALAQLAPGPLAAQLAIYLGYVHYRILGATLAGIAFVIPSFIIVIALGMLYVAFGGLPLMQSIFYGVGAAVIGIIAFSSYKLTNKSIGKDPVLWVIFGVAFLVTVITKNENVFLFIAAGLIYWFIKSSPKLFNNGNIAQIHIPTPLLLQATVVSGSEHKLLQIFLFFLKAGAFVFGSGLAIVPFLYGSVVQEYQWLTEKEFLDAVAVAMITPGPVVIATAFIGYLVAGFSGAAVAAVATFVPCYLFTIIPAPYFKKYGKNPGIKTFVDGVTAAAIGAIAGAVVVLGQRSLTDLPTVLIALVTTLAIWKIKKLQEPFVILAAALVGILLKTFLV